jgi:IMP cyclohydrolase
MAKHPLEALVNMEYPGRFIIVGRDKSDTYNSITYGLTGRSTSSRARNLVIDRENIVRTHVTDAAQLNAGNAALLIYPAMVFSPPYIAVSNGVQTELLFDAILNHGKEKAANPHRLMRQAFSEPVHRYDAKNGWVDITNFEPDVPNNTPRISAIVGNESGSIAIMRQDQYKVVRREGNNHLPEIFPVEFRPGKGVLISTYSGENTDPLPSFASSPLPLGLPYRTPAETCSAVYDALAPKQGDDFRVAVASIFVDVKNKDMYDVSFHIVNRIT